MVRIFTFLGSDAIEYSCFRRPYSRNRSHPGGWKPLLCWIFPFKIAKWDWIINFFIFADLFFIFFIFLTWHFMLLVNVLILFSIHISGKLEQKDYESVGKDYDQDASQTNLQFFDGQCDRTQFHCCRGNCAWKARRWMRNVYLFCTFQTQEDDTLCHWHIQ